MSTLIELRQNLRLAEQQYFVATSILDDNRVSLVVAKENLKQARCEYSEAAMDYCEECMFCSEESLG